MNEKELTEWKLKTLIKNPTWVLYPNLWRIAGKILEVGEISNGLFKRICKMLTKKIASELLVRNSLIYAGGVAENFTDDILGDEDE